MLQGRLEKSNKIQMDFKFFFTKIIQYKKKLGTKYITYIIFIL